MGRIVAVGSRSPLVGLSIISSLPFSSGREKRAYTHHKTFLSLSLFIAVSRFSFRQRCPDAHTNTQTSLSVATAVEEEIDGHEKNWDVRAVGRSTVQARESRAAAAASDVKKIPRTQAKRARHGAPRTRSGTGGSCSRRLGMRSMAQRIPKTRTAGAPSAQRRTRMGGA